MWRLTATHGFSAPATVQAYVRARSLAERAGGAASIQVFNALNGVRGESITRGELHIALSLAERSGWLRSGMFVRSASVPTKRLTGGFFGWILETLSRLCLPGAG
jgi:hypothetical protein